jgi:pantetheine-phosphate adenylyltransferase
VIAIYPGSFNPWHEGHADILNKAFKIFDTIHIVCAKNPDKSEIGQNPPLLKLYQDFHGELKFGSLIIKTWPGLIIDYVKEVQAEAIIRGLRNGSDLQYEQNLQYWNEDLGLAIPVVYFICDRKLAHVSSSAIRSLRPFLTSRPSKTV